MGPRSDFVPGKGARECAKSGESPPRNASAKEQKQQVCEQAGEKEIATETKSNRRAASLAVGKHRMEGAAANRICQQQHRPLHKLEHAKRTEPPQHCRKFRRAAPLK